MSIIAGLLSPLIVMKQRSYLTDTLAHLILPGVVVGLLLSKAFHFEIWICMAGGAIVTAVFGTYLSEWFLKHLKIPPDSSAILCLSAFLALGILILSFNKTDHIHPEDLLFGDALNLGLNNLAVLVVLLISTYAIVFFYKFHWNAWLSDPDFAAVIGFKTKFLDKVFPVLLTLSVLGGFFAVGGLMIPALMTIPAIFSRPKSVLCLSTIIFSFAISLLGFIFGLIFNMPVGPTIVLLGALGILIKTFFAKKCEQVVPSV